MASSSPDRPPAILYGAKSTADPRDSIGTQLEDCRRMAECQGWEVAGEYSDEAASAWSGDRGPGLARAMEHAEREAPSILLVQHSDRLARGDARQAQHLVEIVLWGVKHDVTIRSVQDDLFADERVALLMGAMMGQRNTEDSKRKSEAVKAGMKRRREAGKHNGGRRPYGYRLLNGELLIDEAEAAIVRRIFFEFDAGRTIKNITRCLDAENVPTAYGGRWRTSTVGQILRNAVYISRITSRGDTEGVPGHHPPIVDEELFRRVQRLLVARTRKRGGRPPKGRHLFRGGLLRCECGEAMVPRTRSDWSYYYCNGAGQYSSCKMPSISREKVDTAVLDYFSAVALDLDATRAQLEGERDRRISEVRALREQAESEAQRVAEQLARIRRDYRHGALDASDWQEFRNELTAERDAARAEVTRLVESEAEIEQDAAFDDAEHELLERLAEIRASITGKINDAGDLDAVRAAITRVFEGFVLHPQRGARYQGTGRAELVDVDHSHMVEFTIREEALVDYLGDYPNVRRVPLSLAAKKDREASPSR
jgi:site-specific DNA recombinase